MAGVPAGRRRLDRPPSESRERCRGARGAMPMPLNSAIVDRIPSLIRLLPSSEPSAAARVRRNRPRRRRRRSAPPAATMQLRRLQHSGCRSRTGPGARRVPPAPASARARLPGTARSSPTRASRVAEPKSSFRADPGSRAGARSDGLRIERVGRGRDRRGVGGPGRLADDVGEVKHEIRRRGSARPEVLRQGGAARCDDDSAPREHGARVGFDRPFAVVDPDRARAGETAGVRRALRCRRNRGAECRCDGDRCDEHGCEASGSHSPTLAALRVRAVSVKSRASTGSLVRRVRSAGVRQPSVSARGDSRAAACEARRDVALDGLHREVEPRRDLLVAVAAGDQLEHLALASGEHVELGIGRRASPDRNASRTKPASRGEKTASPSATRCTRR